MLRGLTVTIRVLGECDYLKVRVGTAVTRKAPATAEIVHAIVAEMPFDLRGLRDRSLLLLGFAGALRRSELVALNVDDLEETAEGLRIRQSKTDQDRAGNSSPFLTVLA